MLLSNRNWMTISHVKKLLWPKKLQLLVLKGNNLRSNKRVCKAKSNSSKINKKIFVTKRLKPISFTANSILRLIVLRNKKKNLQVISAALRNKNLKLSARRLVLKMLPNMKRDYNVMYLQLLVSFLQGKLTLEWYQILSKVLFKPNLILSAW